MGLQTAIAGLLLLCARQPLSTQRDSTLQDLAILQASLEPYGYAGA